MLTDKIGVIPLLSERSPTEQRKFAIIVGVNDYEEPINSLNYCVNDARSFYELLVAKERGGYSADYVSLLIDGTERKQDLPMRSNIMSAVNNVVKLAETGDTILFVFSGHGVEEKGKNFLLPADARMGILSETGISLKWIKDKFEESPAKAKIMILDACHAGAIKDKATAGPMTSSFEEEIRELAEGFAVLSSCKLNEVSYEWAEKESGVFSYYLIEGLKGPADTDQDGRVSVSDASKYVTQKVKEWAFRASKQQSPVLEYKVSGDILLSNVPNSLQRVTTESDVHSGEEYVELIELVHNGSVSVSDIGPERAIDEAEKILERRAGLLCAELLTYYQPNEIKREGGSIAFPDGLILLVNDKNYEDIENDCEYSLAMRIKNNQLRLKEVNTLLQGVQKLGFGWNSLEYTLSKPFDVSKLVERCKEANMRIKFFSPADEPRLKAEAEGWGRDGRPADVSFRISDNKSKIKIVQRHLKREDNRWSLIDELEDAFYEKLNPNSIAEFMLPSIN